MLSSNQVYELAVNAKDYARSIIKKGYTQTTQNELENDRFFALLKAISDLRDECLEQKANLGNLEEKTTFLYEEFIAFTTKYSLGNCFELAQQALDYVLMHDKSNIRAEVFEILRGDHVILVINRQIGSFEDDPCSWGEGAIICDPWADMVYAASEYETKLKCLVQVTNKENRMVNYAVKFDHHEHKLQLKTEFESGYLRKHRNIDLLKSRFEIESNKLLGLFNLYITRLQATSDRLAKKYGSDNAKTLTLHKVISDLRRTVKQKELEIKRIMTVTYNGDYRIAREEIKNSYKQFYKEIKKATTFSKHDQTVLFKYDENESSLMQWMRFMNKPSRTEREIVQAITDLNQMYIKNK